MPRYGYSKSKGRYVNLSNEQTLSSASLRRMAREISENAADRMRRLGEALAEGRINEAEFQIGMAEEIKQSQRSAYAMARGGLEQMTASDWGRVGNQVRQQQSYLLRFGADVATRKIEGDAIASRAALYGQAVYPAFENARAVDEARRGATGVQRILEPGAEHCPTCLREAARGYVPPTEARKIGDSECGSNCRCKFQYQYGAEEAAA